jgi:hypothetical protein
MIAQQMQIMLMGIFVVYDDMLTLRFLWGAKSRFFWKCIFGINGTLVVIRMMYNKKLEFAYDSSGL